MQSFVPDSDVIEGQSGFTLRVPKKFYCRETVSRAMYKFTGKYNLTMFPLEEGYVGVSFEGKDAQSQQDTLCVISDFKNELIDQQVRIDLDQRYGLLRDTIVQFAFEPEKKKS